MKKLLSLLLVAAVVFSSMATLASAADYAIADDIAQIATVDSDDGYINANNVNLRSGAGTSYPSLGQVNSGDRFEDYWEPFVYADGYYWCKIKMLTGQNAGKTGWVATTYLTWD
jgi:uncharacterized protein YgiM (DUF1202 family)